MTVIALNGEWCPCKDGDDCLYHRVYLPRREDMALAEAMNCSVQQLHETDSSLVAEYKLTLVAHQHAPSYHRRVGEDESVH